MPLNDQQRQAIEKELFAERKISAIKLYREATGSGLADSTRVVEEMDRDLRQQQPGNFTATNKDGSPMLRGAVTLLIILAITGFVIFKLLHK